MIDLSSLPMAVTDLDAEEYHASWPALSHSGMLKLLETCPAQFHFDAHNPAKEKTTPAKETGTQYHCMVLENARFHTTYEGLPDINLATTAGKQAKEAILAKGRTPVSYDGWQTLMGMEAAIQSHPIAGPLFAQAGDREISLFWEDPLSGVTCRARPDFMPEGSRVIIDLKSALDVSEEALSKAMFGLGYHVEAALYTEGAYACDLRGADAAFVFVSQQKHPPYIITVWTPDDEALKFGRQLVRKARALYAECLRTNHWPPYVTEVAQIGLPAWARRQLEQME